MQIELGCGAKPTPGYIHCDKWKHSDHVDIAFPLEKIPWPFTENSVEKILAIDVFEHLPPWVVSIQDWLDECHRILCKNGTLEMRLPAWDYHYSYRDPTHYKVFHPETFDYWCPPGGVWKDFGRYYFGEGYNKWWIRDSVVRDCNDLRYTMRKV